MSQKVEFLAELIRNIKTGVDFEREREFIMEELRKIKEEQDKFIFK